MPLGTLDRSPPPLFNQGTSALTKLAVCSALAVFLMVADARLKLSDPIRSVIATALLPAQWLVLQPVRGAQNAFGYVQGVSTAQASEDVARKTLAEQALRAQKSDLLAQENARLRALLELKPSLQAQTAAAEVLYDTMDLHTRKVVIDRGAAQGIELGSPVVDERGVLGQVTRVYPATSEVTLISDRDFTIPVLNTRTGARSVAYGDPVWGGGSLELRFMGGNADVQKGDVLTTSGVDGIYPAGLSVATVDVVERRADSGFARIHCTPTALVRGVKHVIVLKPISAQIAPRPESPASAPQKAKGKAP
jgi:rod shape-determining protein MreC